MSPEQRRVIGKDRSLADWAAEAVPAGVVGSVLVQTVRDAGETPEFLALAASSPLVLGVVGWVDLDAGPDSVAAQVDGVRRLPGAERLVGLRDQSADRPESDWALSPAARALFDACGEADLVVDLLLRPDQVPAAIEAVRRHAGTRFVLDHLGNTDFDTVAPQAWRDSVEELAACPAVALKVSALAARAARPRDVRRGLPAHLRAALETFGPSRLMFGSDWPVSQMTMSYAEVVDTLESALRELEVHDPGARDDLWGGTAIRWYGLAVSPQVTARA